MVGLATAAQQEQPKHRTGVKISVKESGQSAPFFQKAYDAFPVVFGRSSECHLPLTSHGFLSRSHGCIFMDNGHLAVMDLNSRNGITIGKERINLHKFHGEVRFSIGVLEFHVEELALPPLEPQGSLTYITSVSVFPGYDNLPVLDAPPPVPVKKVLEKSSEKITERITAKVLDIEESRTAKQRRQTPPAPPVPVTPASAVEQSQRSTERLPFSDIERKPGNGLRAVVFWKNDVLDIRQFLPGDSIMIGHSQSDPLCIPTLSGLTSYGRVNTNQTATLTLPPGSTWDAQTLEPDNVKVKSVVSGQKVDLKSGALLSLNFGNDVRVQFSFSEVNRPFLRRSWIENKEELKNAARISSMMHAVICLLAFFGSPKHDAPKVENIPPRFAKLLVSPPKQIFTPPPPPPPPPPEKKPEPPPPEPKQIAQPKPMKKQPIAKAPKKVTKPMREPPAQRPPPPSEADQLMSALNDFSAKTPPSKVDLSKVKIDSAQTSNFSTSKMMQTLKSKSGKLAASGGNEMPMMNAAVNTKFKGVAGNAGARDVKGQVVGRPTFGGAHGPQGLTDKEVRAELNKHLAAIQQCYERSLLDNASLSGRVEYEWSISPAGAVTDARVKKSEVSGGDSLNECVIGVLRGIRFPSAKNGLPTIVDIGFPFGRS